jgi:hypothetical protein
MKKVVTFLVSLLMISANLVSQNNYDHYRTTGNEARGNWNTAHYWKSGNFNGVDYKGQAPMNGSSNVNIAISSKDTILLNRALGSFTSNITMTVENNAYLKISGDFKVRNHVIINIHPDATMIIEGDLDMHQHGNITINGAMQVNNITGNQHNQINGSGTLHILGEVDNNISVDDNLNQVNYPLDDPMPVDLLSFTGQAYENEVMLHWVTASEINNMGFEVQRLNENFNQWEVIGFVDGHYNHNGILEYSFSDMAPEEGVNYYRLRQMDYDGAYKIYGPVAVVFDQLGSSRMEVRIFKTYNTFRVLVPGANSCQLEVFDLNGNRIHADAGSNAFSFPANGTPVIVRITNEYGQHASQTVL